MTAAESDENIGFCLDCGEEHENIEPDARRYKCEACGERRVYGAEEILVMGTCDEDAADDNFADDHFKIVHVGNEGTTVSTLPIAKTRKPPAKPRIPSINQVVRGKEQSERFKPVAIAILEKHGIVLNAGTMIIAGRPCNPKAIVADDIADRVAIWAKRCKEIIGEPIDDSEELGPGDFVTINEKQCRRMIGKKTREYFATVDDLLRRTAEKHGNVYRWFRSVAIGDQETGTPSAMIGLNTAGERVAVIACVIDEE
jgi:hypothetical protein